MIVAERAGAIPYNVPNAEFGHYGKECSFDAIVKKHRLTSGKGYTTTRKFWHSRFAPVIIRGRSLDFNKAPGGFLQVAERS
jgi:hypothetical protein